jgi:ligand-binding sensor domain-containing protein/signal transduction histidine kinase
MAHNHTVFGMTTRRTGMLLMFAAGLTGCICVYAQNRHSPPRTSASPGENYTARIWQTRDGLPQETVQAVAQTPDGFLWIGTTGGLLRFDGSRFETYERENNRAFQENSVFSLMTGRNGTLWIGTEGGGLIRMEADRFRRFGIRDGLTDEFVRTEIEDPDGNLWIGTDQGLFQLPKTSADHVMRIDNTTAIPAMAVHAMAMARDGTLWVGGSRLIGIRNGKATDYPLIGEYSETRVKSILQTEDGTVWVGTVSGLQRLQPEADRFERFPKVQGTVRALRETRDGTLWIGTIGKGAYTLRDGKLSVVAGGTNDPKLPSKTTLSLFEDAQGNVWMGTQAGLVRFSRSSVELVSLPDASDSDFETISADRDGSLWVAGTGLTHLLDKTAIPTTFPALHGARVRNVFRAQDGTLWIGTDGRGIFRLGPGNSAVQFTTANGLVNNFIRGIVQSRQGDLWIATDEGISRWSHGGFRSFTVQDGLVYFSVRTMIEGRNGDLWIGTDRGLSHLVGEHFTQNAATRALAGEKVWALNETTAGVLWIGTRDHGLYRFDSGSNRMEHFTTEQGLASNSVYEIIQDKKGRLWMSGANGVATVSIADLERLAQDPHAYVGQRFFAVSTGGELTPLYGGTMPAGTITPDGNIWFPTSKGPVEFLANDAESSTVPRVFLDQILADGRTLRPQSGAIVLPAGNRDLEFSYGSILLGPQDDVQFQYKLEGFDSDWRLGSNRRVADYTNLPAGPYTFRVRAFQGGGPLTERAQPILKRQYFFLTWWFLSCCVLVLAWMAWWIHRQKLRRVQAAFQAVLEERARLAREMHDTLIQGCTGVSLLLEAASNEAGLSASREVELLDYARTQLAASIDEARQAVWNLRGQESTDLGETLKTLAERLDRSSNVSVEYSVSGKAHGFRQAAIHEIGMASREAIYNALLHANPTRIDVRAIFGTDEFCLTVVDNGSGFEISNHAREGHFGLKGIEERIHGLGGSVSVTSETGRGTSVAIRVPRAAVSDNKTRAPEKDAIEEMMQ